MRLRKRKNKPETTAKPTEASGRRPGTLSKLRVFWFAVGISALVTVVGYVVGVLAAPPGNQWFTDVRAKDTFAWETAAVAATAAATAVLAGFTAALAFTTSGDVTATWELAAEAKRDRQSRDKPVLVVERIEMDSFELLGDGSASQMRIYGSVRNIGAGPAVRLHLKLRYRGTEQISPRAYDLYFATLTAGDPEIGFDNANFEVPLGRQASEYPLTDFVVEGDYQDRLMDEVYQIIDPRE
jgi:hypothetical protein